MLCERLHFSTVYVEISAGHLFLTTRCITTIASTGVNKWVLSSLLGSFVNHLLPSNWPLPVSESVCSHGSGCVQAVETSLAAVTPPVIPGCDLGRLKRALGPLASLLIKLTVPNLQPKITQPMIAAAGNIVTADDWKWICWHAVPMEIPSNCSYIL